MKKINFKIIYLFSFISIGFIVSCGNKPLFDELGTNRVKVIVKGTYESNDSRPWDLGSIQTYDPSYNLTVTDQSLIPQSRFMIDIAGMRLYSGGNAADFANYRVTYNAALVDTDPFFQNGIIYKNDDMRPNFYWESIGIDIRKMLFDGALDFPASNVTTWGAGQPVQDMFEEVNVNGFNFNLAQVLSYTDNLRVNWQSVNRIFPLIVHFEDGFVFDYNEEEVVIEIRLVIKNFIKKYEYEWFDVIDGQHKLRHYYALSDWLNDVKQAEPTPTNDTMGIIGGNVLGVARYYVPGKTASITGIAGTNRYVIAVKAGHSPGDYVITSLEKTRPSCDSPKPPRVPIT
jgi:hypothetical protein